MDRHKDCTRSTTSPGPASVATHQRKSFDSTTVNCESLKTDRILAATRGDRAETGQTACFFASHALTSGKKAPSLNQEQFDAKQGPAAFGGGTLAAAPASSAAPRETAPRWRRSAWPPPWRPRAAAHAGAARRRFFWLASWRRSRLSPPLRPPAQSGPSLSTCWLTMTWSASP
jgi:hypothetical protein